MHHIIQKKGTACVTLKCALFPYLSIALHGRCSVDCVTMQTIAGHLMSHHTCHNHPRVDPCKQNDMLVNLFKCWHNQNRSTRVLPTNTNLYVVAVRGVFQVIYGTHHIQGHITDVMSMILCLLRSPCDHHVGISNSLNLEKDKSSCYAAALMDEVYQREGEHTQTLKTRCFSLRVSNSVYMVLSMETTCIGVMWLQMRVNPTTSLKRMVTSGNTWEKRDKRGDE